MTVFPNVPSTSAELADGATVTEIDENFATFSRILDAARRRLTEARTLSALEWCRVAAAFATTNSIGALRSVELEDIIDQVARLELAPSRSHHPPKSARRVLHVLTEAHGIGGLTRLVVRWIARDSRSVSSVVITRQDAVADDLTSAALATGGTAIPLGSDGPDSIGRAARLRELASGADFVICHLNSDDVVTALAFGAGYAGPPVAIYNHADHLFWIAPTTAAAVIDARSAGQDLTRGWRGYDTSASLMLPLPIPQSRIVSSPRVDFGLAPSAVVAISVARPIKFQSTRLDPDFADLVVAALEEHPQLVFVAVGPDAGDAPWPPLIERFPGRLIVTGPVPDPGVFLGAADIYLDTFPFSSTTSLLEAASVGLPTLTLDVHAGSRRVFGLSDFVDESDNRPTTLVEYRARLRALIESSELRRASGSRARNGYAERTAEGPWVESLEHVYADLDGRVGREMVSSIGSGLPATDLGSYAIAVLAIEQRIPLLWSVSASLPRFDARERFTARLRCIASRILRRLAPEWNRSKRFADALLVPDGNRRQHTITRTGPTSSSSRRGEFPRVAEVAVLSATEGKE